MLNEQITQCLLQMKVLLVFIDMLCEGFKIAYFTILRIRYIKLYAENMLYRLTSLNLSAAT